MIYTKEMKAAVASIRNPIDGFTVDIVEYGLTPPFLTLQFYHSQWITFSDTEKVRGLQYLDKLKRTLEKFGVRVSLDPILD